MSEPKYILSYELEDLVRIIGGHQLCRVGAGRVWHICSCAHCDLHMYGRLAGDVCVFRSLRDFVTLEESFTVCRVCLRERTALLNSEAVATHTKKLD